MKAVSLLFALMLVLVSAGCVAEEKGEEEASLRTLVLSAEQAADSGGGGNAPEQPTAASKVKGREQPSASGTPVDTAEPTAAVPPLQDTPEPLSSADEGHIYAAAIHQIYYVDHSFGGDPPDFPLVYIATTTDDGTMLDLPATLPQEFKPELMSLIESKLADFPFEVIWVESLNEVAVDPSNGAIAEGQGIYITLGNIYPQEDGTVQLPVFMFCGGLCAMGKTYVLTDVDGTWQVTGSVGMEIMA